MHQGLSAEEVARICIDCKADVIVVESEALLKKVLLVQHKLPELKCIVQWRGEPPLSDQRRLAKSHKKHILSWEELTEIGKVLPDNKLGECDSTFRTSRINTYMGGQNQTFPM